jgi:hypothetical protein
MKVYLKKNITAYSGKDGEEDVVYSSHNQGNVCIARNYTKPTQTPQHLIFKANADAIRSIWSQATALFKDDLKIYAKLLNENYPDKIKATCYSIFIKIIYAYAESEGVDVSTLDIATIRTSVVKSVKSAMDNNFISKVETTSALDNVI